MQTTHILLGEEVSVEPNLGTGIYTYFSWKNGAEWTAPAFMPCDVFSKNAKPIGDVIAMNFEVALRQAHEIRFEPQTDDFQSTVTCGVQSCDWIMHTGWKDELDEESYSLVLSAHRAHVNVLCDKIRNQR